MSVNELKCQVSGQSYEVRCSCVVLFVLNIKKVSKIFVEGVTTAVSSSSVNGMKKRPFYQHHRQYCRKQMNWRQNIYMKSYLVNSETRPVLLFDIRTFFSRLQKQEIINSLETFLCMFSDNSLLREPISPMIFWKGCTLVIISYKFSQDQEINGTCEVKIIF